jgi:hypothetical protein
MSPIWSGWAAVAVLLGGLQAEEPAPAILPGLVAEFYAMPHAIEDHPTFSLDRKPDLRRIDRQINYDLTAEAFPGTPYADHFAVHWKGLLRVATESRYTLFLESDDGSRLFIDGKLVIDNGGLHGMEEKSAEIVLTAGDHEIEVHFFENEGDAGCRLGWEAKNMPRSIIPASAFFHKRDKDLDK